MSASAREQWMPDGEGLTALAKAIIAEQQGTVHLRLISSVSRARRGACGLGLGEWWSGRSDDVTCTRCLEFVHA